jgi:hypothetical protein
MFAAICVLCNPQNVIQLWNSFTEQMTEDFLHRGQEREDEENSSLHVINHVLIENGTNCQRIGLPEPRGEFRDINEQEPYS